MSASPINEIIPREIDNPDLKKILEQFAGKLEEVVNFGSVLMKWVVDECKGGDENAPLVLSLRHILELIDAVSILVRQSSIDPCKLFLRGILESYFGLAYMFKSDMSKQAMAFMVCYVHHNLKLYQKIDPSTPQGKQFRQTLSKDKVLAAMNIRQFPELPALIDNLNSLLKKPGYAEAESEYQRLITAGKSNPNWYSFYNGPKNIEHLATHLESSGIYEILYRSWSGPIHGTDIIQGKILAATDGSSQIVQIRYFKDAQSVTILTLNLALKTYQLFIDNYIPTKKEDYQKWYLTIRDFYLKFSGEPIIKN